MSTDALAIKCYECSYASGGELKTRARYSQTWISERWPKYPSVANWHI